MNDGYRTAACGLLRARLLLCGLRLMMDFPARLSSAMEHEGQVPPHRPQEIQPSRSIVMCIPIHFSSEIQFAPFPMIYACLRRNSVTFRLLSAPRSRACARFAERMPPKPPAARGSPISCADRRKKVSAEGISGSGGVRLAFTLKCRKRNRPSFHHTTHRSRRRS